VTQLRSPGQPARPQETVEERAEQPEQNGDQTDDGNHTGDDQLLASPAGETAWSAELAGSDRDRQPLEPKEPTAQAAVPAEGADSIEQDIYDTREELLEPPPDGGDVEPSEAGTPIEFLQPIAPLSAWDQGSGEEVTLLQPEWRWG